MVEFLFGIAIAILVVLVGVLLGDKIKKFLDKTLDSKSISIDDISVVSKAFAMVGLVTKQGLNKALSDAISKSPDINKVVDVRVEYVSLEIDKKTRGLVRGFESTTTHSIFPFLEEAKNYIACDAEILEEGKYLLDYKTYYIKNGFLFSLDIAITYTEPKKDRTIGDLNMKVYNPCILVGSALERSTFTSLDNVEFDIYNNMPLPFSGSISEYLGKKENT